METLIRQIGKSYKHGTLHSSEWYQQKKLQVNFNFKALLMKVSGVLMPISLCMCLHALYEDVHVFNSFFF